MKKSIETNNCFEFDFEMIEQADCIVLYLDREGYILGMNAYGLDFVGMEAEMVERKPLLGTIIPETSFRGDDQTAIISSLIGSSGHCETFECDIRLFNGKMKAITWSVSGRADVYGDVSEIICIGIDRKAYIAREQSLNSQFDFLESFLEASKVFAFAMNADHIFYYVSPGIQSLCGYAPEELIGKGADIFLPENEKSRMDSLMMEAIRKKLSHTRIVHQIRSKTGGMIWIEVNNNLIYNEQGIFLGFIGICSDINEEKKIELDLSEREKEFQYILENAQVLLVVTDENGIIRNINRKGAHIYGCEPEEMIGHVFTEFLPDFERERAFHAFRRDYRAANRKRGIRTVGMGGIVNKISTPEGLKDILFYKTGVKVYKDGKLIGIMNTAVDITEIVKTREELKQHQEDLERLVAEQTVELEALQESMARQERLAALGTLAGKVSHQIRNPLGTLSNSLYIINERLKGNKLDVSQPIARANRGIRQCNRIIEEALEFTRVYDLRKKKIPIDEWLNDLLDELEEFQRFPCIRELESDLSVNIDPDYIRRVIINILDNAWHAVQEKGDGHIVVRSKQAFNRLEIEVSDTGVGIKRKNLEKIFDPLYSTRSLGVGLGLSICRQIMEQHDGGLDIESRAGEGTIVLIWFRLDAAEMG